MRNSCLPGKWIYQWAQVDCGCKIPTGCPDAFVIGDDLYCETHQRVALVTRVMPAQEAETDELVTMDVESAQVDAE